MPSYHRFDATGAVRIEIDQEGPPHTGVFGPGFVNAVRAVTNIAAASVKAQNPDSPGPDIELAFSLRALPNGEFAISDSSSSGHFQLTLRIRPPDPTFPALSNPAGLEV